jgi:hypothetical protein
LEIRFPPILRKYKMQKWDPTNSGGDSPQPLHSKIGQKVHPVSPEENEAFTKL